MKQGIAHKVKVIEREVRTGTRDEGKAIDEVELKRFLRSERKRMKKLKHAGVKDYLESKYS